MTQADVTLRRLPAPGLRGTFAKAYALLTSIVSKIGWDEMLKIRSIVFVMEEEYRMHKTTASVDMNGSAEDSASVTGVKSPSDKSSDIPTIRISSESTRTPATALTDLGDAPEESVTSAFSNKRLCERWLGGSTETFTLHND